MDMMHKHPEFKNPPCCQYGITDEDYALVLNVWRKEMGLNPIV